MNNGSGMERWVVDGARIDSLIRGVVLGSGSMKYIDR